MNYRLTVRALMLVGIISLFASIGFAVHGEGPEPNLPE